MYCIENTLQAEYLTDRRQAQATSDEKKEPRRTCPLPNTPRLSSKLLKQTNPDEDEAEASQAEHYRADSAECTRTVTRMCFSTKNNQESRIFQKSYVFACSIRGLFSPLSGTNESGSGSGSLSTLSPFSGTNESGSGSGSLSETLSRCNMAETSLTHTHTHTHTHPLTLAWCLLFVLEWGPHTLFVREHDIARTSSVWHSSHSWALRLRLRHTFGRRRSTRAGTITIRLASVTY
jgi:hypothetical protein